MKKLFSNLFLLGLLIPFSEVTKANEYQFFKTSSEIIDSIPTVKFYGVSSSGTETLLNTWESTTTDVESFSGDLEDARVDQYTGKIYFEVNEDKDDDTFISTVLEYDLLNNTVQKLEGISDIEEIVIYPRGINNMISKDDSTGVLSLGENSLKMKETSNSQEMWATDSQGRIAPINITNGSKLLINGRDVEQSINNVGALGAALTGLPTIPTETNLACGLGTGTHGGDFAFSGGCASKVNEKLSINYAASITMPGQDYAGDFEDKFSARAGFVWKLGKAIQPTQISINEKENFETKIKTLEEKNNELLARLERLEKIALNENKSKDLAIYKLK
tara:strand:+ start:141 stop:1139 length:999 start_codon:yes stop_codon:yes gene_type:complete